MSFGWLHGAWSELLRGAWLTIALTLQAIVFGTAIGILGAWAKTSRPEQLGRAFTVYVEIIRNTPFLLQLFFLFFGLPSIGIYLTPDRAALIAMIVNLGAYATEIIRAGIEAVPKSQSEAGLALGLKSTQVFLLIILSPALQIVYPPLVGQFTMILLGSSLASAISAHELTSVANVIASANFRTTEVYFVVACIYLAIVFVFRGVFALLDSRFFSTRSEKRAREQ